MANLICTVCGYAGEANKKARGNGLVEFILWWFFIVPGVIYSIWSRGGNGKNVCQKCGSEKMIPLDTPMGQKLMAEQRNNPDMQIAPPAPQKTSQVGLYVMLIILGGVAVSLIISFSTYKKDAEKSENELKAQQSAQSTQQNKLAVQNLPTEPKARIEAIVKNLGANYEVALFGKNPNAKPVAPFQVVVNTDAGSCALAKQMNFDVMKTLFTDATAKKNIAKVRFNARRYISASMGGDDARESTDKTWAESGPTNFFKVLTQMGSGDSKSKTMERQTWGSEMEGCQ
jgi:type II secretory pathway pseudopilin PulG